MELTVRSNGLASSYSKHYPGSVCDINIFQQRIEIHKKRLLKHEDDAHIPDNGEGHGSWPAHWAILADKGHQGGHEMMRVITPFKKPIRNVLSQEKERYNTKTIA